MVLTAQEKRILESLLARDRAAQATRQQETRQQQIKEMIQRGREAASDAAMKAVNKLNSLDAKLDEKLASVKAKAIETTSAMKSALASKVEAAKQAMASKTAALAMQRAQAQQAQKAQQAQVQKQQLAQRTAKQPDVMKQATDRMRAQIAQVQKTRDVSEVQRRIEAMLQQQNSRRVQQQQQQVQQQARAAQQQYALKVAQSARNFEARKQAIMAERRGAQPNSTKVQLESVAKQQQQKMAQSNAAKILEKKPEQVKQNQVDKAQTQEQRQKLSMNAFQDIVNRGTLQPNAQAKQNLERGAEHFHEKRLAQLEQKTTDVKKDLTDIKDRTKQALVSETNKLEQKGKDRDAAYKEERDYLTKNIDEIQARQDSRARQAAEAEKNRPKWRQSGDLQYSEDNSAYRKKGANGGMDYYRMNNHGEYEFDHQRTSRIKAEEPVNALREQRERAESVADQQKMAEYAYARHELDAKYHAAVEKDKARASELQKAQETLKSAESTTKVDKPPHAGSSKNVQDTKAEHLQKAAVQQQGPKAGSKQETMEQKQAQGPQSKEEQLKAYGNNVVNAAQKFQATKQGREGPGLDSKKEQKDQQAKGAENKPAQVAEWDSSKRTRVTDQPGKPEAFLREQASSNVAANKEQSQNQQQQVHGEDEFAQFKKRR